MVSKPFPNCSSCTGIVDGIGYVARLQATTNGDIKEGRPPIIEVGVVDVSWSSPRIPTDPLLQEYIGIVFSEGMEDGVP